MDSLIVDFYRQSLVLIFGSKIANGTLITSVKSDDNLPAVFWVNQPRWLNDGSLVLPPTGWKVYTGEELEAEGRRYFEQGMKRIDWQIEHAEKLEEALKCRH